MRNGSWKLCGQTLALAGVALAWGVGANRQASAQVAPPTEKRARIAIEIAGDDKAPQEKVQFRVVAPQEGDDLEAKAHKASDYWIGVQLTVLDEFALGLLGRKQAIAAESVIPDSPAAKAGVEKYDVFLQYGDTEVNTAEDLMAAVEKTKDKPVDLKVLRGGKERTLKVVAAKRPQQAGEYELKFVPAHSGDEVRRIEAWVQRLQKGEPGKDPVEMHFYRPGVMLRDHLKLLEFPKDLTISVNKKGNEPAHISVKRGEKSWDVTADKLSELPEEVRPYVENLLGNLGTSPLRIAIATQSKDLEGGGKWVMPKMPGLPRVQVHELHIEKQGLEAVQRQLQEVLKKVDELRAQEESSIPQMKAAVDQLRKELDELRKSSTKPEGRKTSTRKVESKKGEAKSKDPQSGSPK